MFHIFLQLIKQIFGRLDCLKPLHYVQGFKHLATTLGVHYKHMDIIPVNYRLVVGLPKEAY